MKAYKLFPRASSSGWIVLADDPAQAYLSLKSYCKDAEYAEIEKIEKVCDVDVDYNVAHRKNP